MKALKKVVSAYNKVEEVTLVTLITTSLLILFVNVILRYVFNKSIYGADELARVMFIWMSWLGISIGERKSEHVRIDILVSKLHGVPEKVVRVCANLLTLSILAVLVYYGMDVVLNYASKGVTTPMYNIPRALIYFCVPFSCGVMGIRLIINSIAAFNPKEEGGSY